MRDGVVHDVDARRARSRRHLLDRRRAGDEIWVGRQRGGLTRLRAAAGAAFAAERFTQADGLAQDSVYAVHRARDGACLGRHAQRRRQPLSRTARSRRYDAAERARLQHRRGDRSRAPTARSGSARRTASARARAAAGARYTTADGLPVERRQRAVRGPGRRVCGSARPTGSRVIRRLAAVVSLTACRQRCPDRSSASPQDRTRLARGLTTAGSRCSRRSRRARFAASCSTADLREYGAADGLLGVEAVKRHRTIVADARGRIWVAMNRGVAVADPGRAGGRALPALTRVETPVCRRRAGRHAPAPIAIPLEPPPRRVRVRRPEPVGARARALPLPARRVRRRLERAGRRRQAGLHEPRAGPVSFSRDRVEQRRAVERAGGGARVHDPADVLADRLVSRSPPLVLAVLARLGRSTVSACGRWRGSSASGSRSGWTSARGSRRSCTIRCCRDSSARRCSCTSRSIGCPTIRRRKSAARARPRSDGTRDRRRAQRRPRPALDGRGAADDLEQAFSGDASRNWRSAPPRLPRRRRRARRGRWCPRSATRSIGSAARRWSTRSGMPVPRPSKSSSNTAPRELRLFVRDDGRGIDEDVARAGIDGHWGITGMRERAERIGATPEAAEPGRGRHRSGAARAWPGRVRPRVAGRRLVAWFRGADPTTAAREKRP